MIIITAVDDNLGMMFNHRRQSKDEELRKYILKLTADKKLFMNEYTAKQFADTSAEVLDNKNIQENIIVDEMFLETAGENDYCFVENVSFEPYLDKVDMLLLCKWNRKYPSDMKLVFPFDKWELISSEELAGKSHEMITVETWSKTKNPENRPGGMDK